MALINIAVVESVVVAGRVHAFAAPLALSATRMNLDCDARADLVFVDTGSKRDDRAHVLMAGGEVLVERQPTLNRRRRTVIDDLKIGCTDRNRIDTHQYFRLFRN